MQRKAPKNMTKPYALTMPDGTVWRTVCRVVHGGATSAVVRRWDPDEACAEDVVARWDDELGAWTQAR